jgi:hypothetical protein
VDDEGHLVDVEFPVAEEGLDAVEFIAVFGELRPGLVLGVVRSDLVGPGLVPEVPLLPVPENGIASLSFFRSRK